MTTATPPLHGRRVVTTRDTPGRLDALLADLGAEVVHVPLIEIVDPDDPALDAALVATAAGRYEWVVVTSQHGAARVGAALAGSTARTAAVGTRTAGVLAELTGRAVDVVPDRQTAADLVAAMPDPEPGTRVLAALADRAAPTLVEGLRARGYEVDDVIAYRTRLRRPTAAELVAVRSADAVAFASGSAAEAWASAMGTATPAHVVVIGPTTAAAARAAGLTVTAVAAAHTLDGLADAVVVALRGWPGLGPDRS